MTFIKGGNALLSKNLVGGLDSSHLLRMSEVDKTQFLVELNIWWVRNQKV